MSIKGIDIGGLHIDGKVFLGPMAGVSDLPFRILCKEQGAALVSMEMISAKAICFNNAKTWDLMKTVPEEAPVALQLFGHEEEAVAEACDRLKEKEIPFDVLDFNMGCPVPKIVKNGDGSALMQDPAKIESIVKAMVAHTDRPVTVKIRKGFTEDTINAVECALAAEAGGASAVAVHARTRPQMYSGKADWTIIRAVKEALHIPVIGNGDVTGGTSAERMLDETGCDAVMVARAAKGNPWVFKEIDTYLSEGGLPERPSNREVIRMLLRHAKMLVEEKGERIAMNEMRSHAAWYLAGFPGASKLRGRISQITTLEELQDLLQREFPYA